MNTLRKEARGNVRGSLARLEPNMTPISPAAAAGPASYRTIQALRAIAALLVVLYHAFEMWGLRMGSGAAAPSWPNGAAGVDIFFVISGFVMVVAARRLSDRPGAAWVFVQHRIVRIVPLYWLLTTAKLVLVFALAELALRSTLGADSVLRSYLFLPVVDSAGHFRPLLPVGWTLTYELIFYLLFALALAVGRDVLRIALPVFAVFIVLALARAPHWPEWTILFDTIVIEFVFGVVLARMVLRGLALPAVGAAVLAAIGLALILTVPQGSEALRPVTWGIPALAVVAGTVCLEQRLAQVIPRWLLALGDASYSIYLTHGFLLPAIGILVSHLQWGGASALVATVTLCLLTSAIVGWSCYLLVERPMTAYLKSRTMRAATSMRSAPAA